MRVAVIGFGMMGRQIAQVFAQHGSEVAVTDENPVAVKSGLDEVAHGPYGIESAVAKAKITREEGAKTLLTVSKIGSRLSKKDRLLGMHFFNPAQITKLVEIVKTDETSERAIQEAAKIVESIGKTPIIAQDEPGFIANRLGLTLYLQASKLLEEETANIHDIDLAMKLGYNHPMGPFELADFVGLDTRLRNLEALFQATGDEKWIPPKALREMVNQGYMGDPSRRKGSKGGYHEFFETTH